jgi:hypothetical protein
MFCPSEILAIFFILKWITFNLRIVPFRTFMGIHVLFRFCFHTRSSNSILAGPSSNDCAYPARWANGRFVRCTAEWGILSIAGIFYWITESGRVDHILEDDGRNGPTHGQRKNCHCFRASSSRHATPEERVFKTLPTSQISEPSPSHDMQIGLVGCNEIAFTCIFWRRNWMQQENQTEKDQNAISSVRSWKIDEIRCSSNRNSLPEACKLSDCQNMLRTSKKG